MDSECIELISKSLCPDPGEEKSQIVECCPGPGFLTQHLLHSGLPHIHLFEHHDSDYMPLLDKLVAQHKDRVSLKTSPHPIADFARDLRIGLDEILKRSPDEFESRWREEPPVKIFLPAPVVVDRTYVNLLIMDLSRRDGVFAPGRCQIFLMTTYFPLSVITADPSENQAYFGYNSVMVQSMFDVEVKGCFPLQACVPLIRRTRKLAPESPHLDINKLYLYTLTPKAALIDLIPIDYWNDYRFFVRQAMCRKTGYVIPFLEKYFPSCGSRLIETGVPLYSRFVDLTAEDFVRIFNECTNWPEYNTSTFKMASASFADESDDEEEGGDHLVNVSEDLGGQKLVSDVFA